MLQYCVCAGRVASFLNLNMIAFQKNVRMRAQPFLTCFDHKHRFCFCFCFSSSSSSPFLVMITGNETQALCLMDDVMCHNFSLSAK